MAVPISQQLRIGSYLADCRLKGIKKPPIVLMLEPSFKTNLEKKVCGKTDYPDSVLNESLSPEKCIYSTEECKAPIVSISGGEPLLNPEMPEIIESLLKKKKYTYLCTNGLLLSKNIFDYEPSPYLTIAVDLDGIEEEHDKIAGQLGVYESAVQSIRLAKTKGFKVAINCTVYSFQRIKNLIEFFNYVTEDLKVDGINVSPGFSYERAIDKENFLNRENVKKVFRNVFKSKMFKKWKMNHTNLYLDFLAGNQTYLCTQWATPTRNIFGWQRPCYHLSEGYCKTFEELIEKTDWKKYGLGNYEKCNNCMSHCGFEPTAVMDTFENPFKGLTKKFTGIKTTGPVVEDISILGARPSENLYDQILESKMYELDLMD